MTDWILSHEPVLCLGSFFAVFALMALWELFAARRTLYQSRGKRGWNSQGRFLLTV